MTELRHVEDEFNDWAKNLGVNAEKLWAKIEERWDNIQRDARITREQRDDLVIYRPSDVDVINQVNDTLSRKAERLHDEHE